MKAKRLASINGDSDTNLLLVQKGYVGSTISGWKLLVGRDVELNTSAERSPETVESAGQKTVNLPR